MDARHARCIARAIAASAFVSWVAMTGTGCAAYAANAAPAQGLTDQAVKHYETGQQDKALALFKQAAEQGNRLAQFDYAMMLLNGEGGAASPQEALQWLKRAAEAGMSQAQYVYGKMFDDGYVVGKSIPDANRWYEKAAKQGHTQAQAAIANEYFIGRGVPRDYRIAFEWYAKAAQGGDLPSQYIVASYYERGYGVVTPDLDQARVWYARAAAQGDVAARGKLDALNRQRASGNGAAAPAPGR
ncbi:Secretory immunoglobulin A-binding protein EsiB [Pandoraea terrae]|uniref:Secretory immunoglobulin A-binding protein EsiB n=1 Tax=Pandoraea terrae TaxID=1537710 RepID=A0A5E4T9U7_9BURK|nr:tetratricopeptide repeat protein [Pandoraea terrae]VVD84880.1 Secretory immunoglobulin A-binding protein EsiB [Pandoraea terrae]